MSTFSDEIALSSLLGESTIVAPESQAYASRKLAYLNPTNPGLADMVQFDTQTIRDQWTDWRESYVHLPITITSSDAMVRVADLPPIAFKTSALSAIHRVVVRTSNGATLLDEQHTMPFSKGVELLFERDRDWVEAQAAEIHYSRDRPKKGVVGLKSNAEIAVPNISKYSAAPDAGVAGDSNNADNPRYNEGFHERCQMLFSSAHDDLGVVAVQGNSLDCTLRLPLRQIHDFFREWDFPITGAALTFEFYMANSASGSYVNPLVIGSAHAAAGLNVGAFAGPVSIALNTSAVTRPRLYYHSVKFRPEHHLLVAEALSQGIERKFLFRRYELHRTHSALLNRAPGQDLQFELPNQLRHAKRLWVFCYPFGRIETSTWPSATITGPCGLTNVELSLNGQRYYNLPLASTHEQYQELKQAMAVGVDSGELESLLPYEDFRLRSRVMCLDFSRAGELLPNPNEPMTVSISAQVQAPAGQNVDIVLLSETIKVATMRMTPQGATWTVDEPQL